MKHHRLFLAFATGFLALEVGRSEQQEEEQPPIIDNDPDSYFRPGEERSSFDWVMEPYPIPLETTTYVNFAFNLPEDTPDLFHVTFGELINSQPLHLHHFVVQGCRVRFEESEHGLPHEGGRAADCSVALGGWAPGSQVFGNFDLDTGVLMGRGIGVEAILLNVHYTDGVYDDESLGTLKMAQDGIRVHYTPVFRKYTSMAIFLIDVAYGPESLTVPPGEERFFLTRTCKVGPSCKDASPDFVSRIARMGVIAGGEDEVSCEDLAPFCGVGEPLGPWIQRYCPATCGFCGESAADEAPNPLTPPSYRVSAVQYHAHLLGTEMYTTLIREEEEEEKLAVERNADAVASSPIMVTKDLESREFWWYDYQETIPLPYEGIRASDGTELGGVEVKPGDKIQVTCVYDSTYRTDPTTFELSTYDEMCVINAYVTIETPPSLLLLGGGENGSSSSGIDPGVELRLMTFSCEIEDDTDVYTGRLTPDEDARDIWRDHPIEDAEGCTYPVTVIGIGLRDERCPTVVAEEEEDGESEEKLSPDEDESAAVEASSGGAPEDTPEDTPEEEEETTGGTEAGDTPEADAAAAVESGAFGGARLASSSSLLVAAAFGAVAALV